MGYRWSGCFGLIGVRTLTTLLSPEEYGELALGVSVAMLGYYVVGDTVYQKAMRFFAISREQGLLAYFYKGLKGYFISLASIASLLGVIIIAILFLWGRIDLVVIGIPIFLFALLNSTNGMLDGIRNGARNRKVVAFHQAFFQWSRFLIAAVLIVFFGSTAVVTLWGYALSALLVVVSQLLFLQRADFFPAMHEGINKTETDGLQHIGKMRDYARPFLFIGAFTWILYFADRWALKMFCSLSSVGYYAALYQVGYFPILFGSTVFVQLIAPVIFERASETSSIEQKKKSNAFNRKVIFSLLMLCSLLCVLLHYIHHQLFAIFVAPNYLGVSYLLPYVVLSAGLYAAGNISLVSVLSRFESGRILPMKIITSVIGIVCYASGAYLCGLNGIIFGGLIFSLSYLVGAIILETTTRNLENSALSMPR